MKVVSVFVIAIVCLGVFLVARGFSTEKSQQRSCVILPSELPRMERSRVTSRELGYGCVEIQTVGGWESVVCSHEIWKKGKMVKRSEDFSHNQRWYLLPKERPDVKVISRRKLFAVLAPGKKEGEYMVNVGLWVDGNIMRGYTGNGVPISLLEEIPSDGIIQTQLLHQSIKLQEEKPVAFLAFTQGEDSHTEKASIEDLRKVADWAFILKVAVQ